MGHQSLVLAVSMISWNTGLSSTSSFSAAYEQFDTIKLICGYDIRPGIFIPFFQKETLGYHDPRMERDADRLEVQLFGTQPDTFLPVSHNCGLFTEKDTEDSTISHGTKSKW